MRNHHIPIETLMSQELEKKVFTAKHYLKTIVKIGYMGVITVENSSRKNYLAMAEIIKGEIRIKQRLEEQQQDKTPTKKWWF